MVRVLTGITAIAAPVAAIVLGIPVPWLVAGGCVVGTALLLRSAIHFYREAHPEFPRHDIDVGRLWYLDVQQTSGHETRYVLLPVRYTNRDPQRPVNLHFEILSQRVFQEQALDMPTLTASESYAIRQVALPTPLKVKPLDTEKGEVAFDALGAIAFEYDDETHGVTVRPHARITLRVTDYASGAVLERSLDVPQRS